MGEIGPAAERKPRQRRRLPAGGEQQLPADRAVEPRELDEGQREIRGQPEDEAVGPGVRQDGRGVRLSSQSGPAGSGCCIGPPPCAACSFIFLIFSATWQALALKAAFLTWLSLRLWIASSGNEHQSLFFSI